MLLMCSCGNSNPKEEINEIEKQENNENNEESNSQNQSNDNDSTNENSIPLASIKLSKSSDKISLDGSNSSDEDGDQLTFIWKFDSQNPSTINLHDSTVSIVEFKLPTVAGEYKVSLTVSDGKDKSTPKSISFTIEATNQPTTELAISFHDVPRADANMLSVAYGNGKFVAVGYYGNPFYNQDKGSLNISTDGTNWEEVSSMTGSTSWSEVKFIKDKFYVVGDYGVVASSTDGTNWEKQKTSEEWHWKSIAANDTNLVMVGASRRFAVGSIDDIENLSIDKSNYSSDYWHSVIYAKDIYVTVGKDGRVGYSENKTNWTFKTMDKANYSRFGTVVYGDSQFIATKSLGSLTTFISSNGKDWVSRKNDISIQGISYTNNKFVLLGTHLHNEKIYLSDNSEFSTPKSFEAAGDWKDACYGDGKYVIVGNKIAVIK